MPHPVKTLLYSFLDHEEAKCSPVHDQEHSHSENHFAADGHGIGQLVLSEKGVVL